MSSIGQIFETAAFQKILEADCVVISPVTWTPNGKNKKWAFHLACKPEDCDEDFYITGFVGQGKLNNRGYLDTVRDKVIFEITQVSVERGGTLHITDDEADMVKLCEAIWPGSKARKLRQETERNLRHNQ